LTFWSCGEREGKSFWPLSGLALASRRWLGSPLPGSPWILHGFQELAPMR